MTESIDIPKRQGKQKATSCLATPQHQQSYYGMTQDPSSTSSSLQSFNPSSMSYSSPLNSTPGSDSAQLTTEDKGKAPAREWSDSYAWNGERRTSWLSSSLSKSEHTVVNIGDAERPRLITCVKASQGFDWNQDIFLPSYCSDYEYSRELERRQDPVDEIFVTDEEAAMYLPR